MTRGRARPHLKRVSPAPKERWCGVPCTLLVAAWSLFILLLLTSSFSHRDDEQAARVLEESDFATQQELTSARLLGRGGDDHPYSDGQGFFSSSLAGSSSVENGRLSLLTTNSDETEQQPSSITGVDFPIRITFQQLGQPIDALQYAEYGAGLLQKSSPAEENSKICLVRNPSGTSCRVISHRVEFAGRKCALGPASQSAKGEDDLAGLEEVVAEEHELCHDALTYGRDLVAEIEPEGEFYLLCQVDPLLTETAVCGVARSTLSECLLAGVDSNSEDASNRHRLTSEAHQNGEEQVEAAANIADESMSSDHPHLIEEEGERFSRRITLEQKDEELYAPIENESGSNSLSQQDLEELRKESQEGNANEIPKPVVDVEEIIKPGDHINEEIKFAEFAEDVTIEEIAAAVEFLAPLVESEATGRESLLDPAEHGVREDDRDLDDELLMALPAETELGTEEPRRLKRVGSVMSLEEYKRSILESQRKNGNQVNLSSVQAQQKVRHSDESYNYASATHGAKVLASNKEAKGASHILTSDKDKYLRNPCGTEDKYVVLELSEEAFVDTIFISNFEFHSSNLKDFELLGSPVYPTKDWISLGKFQAENVRNRQKFTIEDPKLVRHLMVKMLTHWGSEFFCTLSIVEVFGVDVIKNLLDDWIALEEGENNPRTQGSNALVGSQEESSTAGGGTSQQSDTDADLDDTFTEPLFRESEVGTSSDQQEGVMGGRDSSIKTAEGDYGDEDSKAGSTGDISAQEVMHTLGAKPPSESVLKILMERVKELELNQKLFDLYLGDLNQKYKVMLSELDKDLALVTERLRNQTTLTASLAMRLADRELQRKEEKLYMEHHFAQIASNFSDNLDFMRWQIQSMERREITAILLAFLCMILSALLHLLASCLPRRNPTHNASAQTRSGEEFVVKKEVLDSEEVVVKEEVFDSEEVVVKKEVLDSEDIVDSKVVVADSNPSGIDSKLTNVSVSIVCQRSSSFVLYLACGLTILVLSV